MSRRSAWNGNRVNNKRPYISYSPDAYVAIQGETFVIGCGECKRKIDLNQYLTSISVDTSVDSPPGNATINLTVPDTDINDFYAENNLVIIPMMEVEIFAKGYYLVGGVPQYYKIFWGLVTSTNKSWSNGVTTVSINCRDILRWWELTQIKLNPSFIDPQGSSAGGYQLFQNQFAGRNPYTVIMELAKEAMGDWSQSVSSFLSFNPEQGGEANISNDYLGGVMAYWQTKFKNIWNNLVLYGASGTAYSTFGDGSTVSTLDLSLKIFEQEWKLRKDESQANAILKLSPAEIAAYKVEIPRAGDVSFFEPEARSKFDIAMEARNQIGYEFYCDTTGDIVFKPPFFNLNVLPNKPVSWIQDIDVIDDSIQEQETEVFTHIVASGNAFGGVTDYGVNDEFTTPRTGAYDFHLLKRYGWRKYDFQAEWAGNPRKLFYHILDYLDRLNSKRQTGTVTIPMRPEIRMGFPIWFPKYDSFFYVQGISHNFSAGSQATTTLTLTARRSKFLAPRNIGKIELTGYQTVPLDYVYVDTKGASTPIDKKTKSTLKQEFAVVPSYSITFPDSSSTTDGNQNTAPIILRHPRTGKLLGYPRVVMVFKKTVNGEAIAKALSADPTKQKATQAGAKTPAGPPFDRGQKNAFLLQLEANKEQLLSRIRQSRYEAGASNAGAFDYAEDVSRTIKEFLIINVDNITWNNANGGNESTIQGVTSKPLDKNEVALYNSKVKAINEKKAEIQKKVNDQNRKVSEWQKILLDEAVKLTKDVANPEDKKKILENNTTIVISKAELDMAQETLKNLQKELASVEKERLVTVASQSKFIPSPMVIIRPVSDEFGFEVIGHYRYGRGSFIDRGKLKIQNGQDIVNQMDIQFAPTGGLLTESVSIQASEMSDPSVAFEQMRPDDWATGATYTWNGTNTTSDILITDTTTYSADIQQNVGKSVFIEVDATRKSVLLSELKPNITIKGLTDSVADCACGIGKADWISILPISAIREILSAPGAVESGSVVTANRENATYVKAVPTVKADGKTSFEEASKPDGSAKLTGLTSGINQNTINSGEEISIIKGGLDQGSFFNKLYEYLVKDFNTNLSDNKTREAAYSGEILRKTNPYGSGPLEPVSTNTSQTSNIYSPPGGALLDRAAMGDQKAIDALRNQANFNFNQLEQGTKEFQDAYFKGKDKINNTWNELKDQGKGIWKDGSWANLPSTAASGSPPEQVQPPPVPPSFSEVVNPGKFGQGPLATDYVNPTSPKILP